MRFYTVLSSRPQYYDRNPLTIVNSYFNTIGPAGPTTRWTYTVPAGRKAFVQLLVAKLIRVTVAAPADAATVRMRVQPNGGSSLDIFVAALNGGNDVDTSRDQAVFGAAGELSAGDNILATTFDASTGGTIQYLATMWAVEFDA